MHQGEFIPRERGAERTERSRSLLDVKLAKSGVENEELALDERDEKLDDRVTTIAEAESGEIRLPSIRRRGENTGQRQLDGEFGVCLDAHDVLVTGKRRVSDSSRRHSNVRAYVVMNSALLLD